jgi:phytanoyl-CoA hydroxylase
MVEGASRRLLSDGLVESAHASERFGRRMMALIEEAGSEAVMSRLKDLDDGGVFGIAKAHGPEADEAERPIYEMVTHPDTLDILEALMGPTISYSYKGIMRARLPDDTEDSRNAKPFPYHQDSQYFDLALSESRAGGKHMDSDSRPVTYAGQPVSTENLHIVTVWAPLVDTDATNGALTLVPGSHRWGQLDGQRDDDGNMQAYHRPERARVEGAPHVVEDCPAGGAIFFNNLVFHGSGPNRSNAVRWSLDWRYDAGAEGSGPASQGGTPAAKAAVEW